MPLERIDEESFEHIHTDVDDGGFDDDGASCDDVDESSLVIQLPSYPKPLMLDGVSAGCDIRADRDAIMTDDGNSIDSNLQDQNDPGLDGRVGCDQSPATHNASKDKPLCTEEPSHINETDVFDGPLDEKSLAQRLPSNLQIATANLQPCEWLTDATISSVLDLVPRVSIQILSGSYLTEDNYCTIGTGRLRIRNGATKVVAPVPLKYPSLHWCLGVFDLGLKTVTLYNSWPHEQYSAVARSVLMRCGDHISQQNPQYEGPWEWHEALEFPQQDNGWDCGVFTLVAAIHIMLDITPPTIINGTLWRSLFLTLVNKVGLAQTPQACTSASASVTAKEEAKDDADFAKLQSSVLSINSVLDNLQTMSGVIRAVLGQIVIQIHKGFADCDLDGYIRTLDAFSSSRELAQIPAEHTKALMTSLARTREGLVARSKVVARQREYHESLTKVWNAGVDFVDLSRSAATQSKREVDKMMSAYVAREQTSIASLQAGLDRRREALNLAVGTRPAETKHA